MMDEASTKLVSHKIKTAAADRRRRSARRPRDKKVIMCHGTFDIVHPGHIRHLLYAKSKGDILVASLTADAHIIKANFRPFVPQELRAFNLAALEMVDYVVIDKDADADQEHRHHPAGLFRQGLRVHQGRPASAHGRGEGRRSRPTAARSSSRPATSSTRRPASSRPSRRRSRPRSCWRCCEAEGLDFDSLRGALDQASRASACTSSATPSSTATPTPRMIGGMTKTPTMSVRFENRNDFVGGAGIVAKHLKAAGADVTLLDRARRRRARGVRAQGSGSRRRATACRSSTARGRPPTRTPSSPAATACSRSTRSTTARSPTASFDTLAEQIVDTPADIVVFSDFRHGIFNRDTIPPLTKAIPHERVPRRRQPGRQPLGQHPRVPGLRSDHAQRARGALRARRPGFWSCARSGSSSIGRPPARR